MVATVVRMELAVECEVLGEGGAVVAGTRGKLRLARVPDDVGVRWEPAWRRDWRLRRVRQPLTVTLDAQQPSDVRLVLARLMVAGSRELLAELAIEQWLAPGDSYAMSWNITPKWGAGAMS